MTDLRIRRFNKRYRLSGDTRAETKRLDHVLREAIDSELIEAALARAGIQPTDEICIRSVSSAARLDASDSDSRIATAWSMSIAQAIAESLSERGPDVVRYGSRHHGLLDMICSSASGELSRAWAWRQLGFWEAGDEPKPSEVADQVADALSRNPFAAPALLRELGKRRLLTTLLRTLNADQLTRIAREALSAATGQNVFDAHASEAIAGDDDISPIVDRVLAKSAILRAIGWPIANVELARSLAILAVLECDPAAAMTRASSIVTATMQRLSVGRLDQDSERADAREHHVSHPQSDQASRSRARRTSPSNLSHKNGTAPGGTEDSENSTRDSEPIEARDSGSTDRGGLLFLLHFIRDLDIGGLTLSELGLGMRSVRWTLHQLALDLAPIDERDPAALAFAGLPPSADPPTGDESPPSEEDRVALSAIRKTLLLSLRDRIDASPAESDSAVLLRVTSRRAEIVADPGWIEVHLDLSEVTTDVRRAGLDLDLGWLPMLGVVVRFVYA